jgi:hypothetical protein
LWSGGRFGRVIFGADRAVVCSDTERTASCLASEDFWDDLLGHLRDRALLPVVGPELATVRDGERRVSLSRLLGD